MTKDQLDKINKVNIGDLEMSEELEQIVMGQIKKFRIVYEALDEI